MIGSTSTYVDASTGMSISDWRFFRVWHSWKHA